MHAWALRTVRRSPWQTDSCGSTIGSRLDSTDWPAAHMFLDWLSSANLCLANTFFHQPRSDGGNVGTWRHPASRDWYQLDYFIASTDTRVRYIVDSGKYDRYSVLSDHAPIAVKLKVPCPGHLSGGRQRGSASARAIGDPGADLRSLRWPETAARFNTDVLDVMALKAASPPPQQVYADWDSVEVLKIKHTGYFKFKREKSFTAAYNRIVAFITHYNEKLCTDIDSDSEGDDE